METLGIRQAKISAKGWVVIPAALRRRYGLTPGTIVNIADVGDRLEIYPQQKGVYKKARGMLPAQPSLTEELMAEHAGEVADEQA